MNAETHTPVLSHEPCLEPTKTRNVDLGKHSIYTHFPKDRNCEICQRTNITSAPCRRRIGGAVFRTENFGYEFLRSGARLTRRQLTSRPDQLWTELWIKLRRNVQLKEKHKWPNEKPKLDNARRFRGIYYIDFEDKEFKETIRNAGKNWKHQWLLLCSARQARHVSMETPVAKPLRSNQNLRASWKPVNPQECVWKNLYRIITKSILQEEEIIHYNITIWFTNLFLCPKP